MNCFLVQERKGYYLFCFMYLERDRLLLDYKYFLYEKSLDCSGNRSSKILKEYSGSNLQQLKQYKQGLYKNTITNLPNGEDSK